MRKGVKATVLGLLCILAVSCVAACGGKSHTHTYSDAWKSDGTYHWHEATCEHTDKVSGKAKHSGDPCTVCGYTAHEHTFSNAWKSDEKYHWHEATCEHTNEVSGKGEHSGNPCSVCGNVVPTAGVTYALSEDGETAAATGIGTATDATIYIASEYEGKPVTEIAANAFRNYEIIEGDTTSSSMPDSVTRFVLPDSVTDIGATAFFNSRHVTEVVFGKGLLRIGKSAFEESGLGGTLILPENLEEIGASAFASLQFESAHFPTSLTSLGAFAFSDVQTVTSESGGAYFAAGNCLIERATKTLVLGTNTSAIPNDGSVEHIGESAFLYREGLKTIVLPSSLKTIESKAFRKCTSLTSIIIPEGVTSLGAQAFYGCSALTSIVLPVTLSSVGKDSCSSATKLERVYYAGTSEQWNKIKFASSGGLTFGGSDKLKDTTRYYYSESAPSDSTKAWHWVDGKPVAW